MSVTVSQINIFPIKSCRGMSLPHGTMTARGFALDRQWMLVNNDGDFLTQRQLPKMSQILPEIASAENQSGAIEMQLSAPDMAPFKFSSSTSGDKKTVVVWNDTCEATDEGDEVASWFSEYLETTCRLVRFNDDFVRQVDQKYSKSDGDQVGFADGFPFLLISQESLDDLNGRLDKTIPMNRFRPNIVVKGCSPFEEDEWKTIKIGEAKLHVVKPCARCVITCTDQDTSKVTVEPLRTLWTYRNEMNKILFGQNLVPEDLGNIKIGDQLHVLN